jgi:hypothetical protein
MSLLDALAKDLSICCHWAVAWGSPVKVPSNMNRNEIPCKAFLLYSQLNENDPWQIEHKDVLVAGI